MTPHVAQDDVAPTLAEAHRLMDAGRSDAAVRLLTDAHRRAPHPAIEVLLVSARHRAFSDPSRPLSDEPWPPPTPDAFAGVAGLPEVAATELTSELLASALQHHGSLIVRGLLTPAVADSLLGEVRRAFEAAEAAAAGAPVSETSPWYVPFEPTESYDFGWVERLFSRQVGAVLAVEAPRALFHIIEALRATGIGEVVAEYLGEHPALSAKKTSLRRARPDSPTEWHQDGSFLGEGIRTVNVWTALTPCGANAPSVDVFAGRSATSWTPAPTTPSSAGRSARSRPSGWTPSTSCARCSRPVTPSCSTSSRCTAPASRPSMSEERYAIESWFFAPSTYPHEQVPLAF